MPVVTSPRASARAVKKSRSCTRAVSQPAYPRMIRARPAMRRGVQGPLIPMYTTAVTEQETATSCKSDLRRLMGGVIVERGGRKGPAKIADSRLLLPVWRVGINARMFKIAFKRRLKVSQVLDCSDFALESFCPRIKA